METESMRDMLAQTEAELAKVEAKIARHQRHADALRQVSDGLRAYLDIDAPSRGAAPRAGLALETGVDTSYRGPGAPGWAPTGVVGPRGKEAVRIILSEQPGVAMSIGDIAEQIKGRGWIDPKANVLDATRTHLLRAVKAYAEIERVGHGVYAYRVAADSHVVGQEEENAEGPAFAGPSGDTSRSAAGTADPDSEEVTNGEDRDPDHHHAPVTGDLL